MKCDFISEGTLLIFAVRAAFAFVCYHGLVVEFSMIIVCKHVIIDTSWNIVRHIGPFEGRAGYKKIKINKSYLLPHVLLRQARRVGKREHC